MRMRFQRCTCCIRQAAKIASVEFLDPAPWLFQLCSWKSSMSRLKLAKKLAAFPDSKRRVERIVGMIGTAARGVSELEEDGVLHHEVVQDLTGKVRHATSKALDP